MKFEYDAETGNGIFWLNAEHSGNLCFGNDNLIKMSYFSKVKEKRFQFNGQPSKCIIISSI